MDKIIELRREEVRLSEEIRALLDKEDRSTDECDQLDKLLDDLDACKREISQEERGESLGVRNPVVPPNPGAGAEDRTFKSFGEQLRAVITACSPGGEVDPRLREERATGMSEGVPADGGFLVQSDFSTVLLEEARKESVLAPLCRRIPISETSNRISLPMIDESSRVSTRFGGVLAYWKDEAAAKTASKPKFRSIELKLKKLIGLCYLTDELLQDTTALEAFVNAAFAEEFGFKLDDAIIRGTGVGQPLGVLASGCLVTVNKEVGQAADTIVAENPMKMRARLRASSRANSVWLINQECEPQLQSMAIAVGTGGVPVYMPAGGLSGDPYDRLYNRPVHPIEQASALGDVGDIILGDFSKYLMIDKGGMQTASSIHVNFVYDESVLRFVLRVDGQPIYNTALTPYKGAGTLSPFVTLQAR